MSDMSTFRVTVEVGNRQGDRFEPIEMLVDTGATYTWLPRSILRRIGVEPSEERVFILADGRHAYYGMVQTMIRLEGRVIASLVVFGDDGTEPLLGAVTLEEFGLGVDAVNQRLIPTPALLKGVSPKR